MKINPRENFRINSMQCIITGKQSNKINLTDETKNRGSYMSAHVLLNLLNEVRKRDKMRGLPSILSLLLNEFDELNNTGTQMLDSIYNGIKKT